MRQKYIYIYKYIYRKFSPVARLGGLAPARPNICNVRFHIHVHACTSVTHCTCFTYCNTFTTCPSVFLISTWYKIPTRTTTVTTATTAPIAPATAAATSGDESPTQTFFFYKLVQVHVHVPECYSSHSSIGVSRSEPCIVDSTVICHQYIVGACKLKAGLFKINYSCLPRNAQHCISTYLDNVQ